MTEYRLKYVTTYLKGRVGIPLEEDIGEREEELTGDDEDHPKEGAGAEVVVHHRVLLPAVVDDLVAQLRGDLVNGPQQLITVNRGSGGQRLNS